MSEEEKSRALFEKAKTLRAERNIKDAIKQLQTGCQRNAHPAFLNCFDLLFELALCEERGAFADSCIGPLKSARTKLHRQKYKEVCDLFLRHFRAMCAAAREHAQNAVKSPAESDLILAALSGISLETRTTRRFVDPCERSASRLAPAIISLMIGNSLELRSVSHNLGVAYFGICHEFRLASPLKTSSMRLEKAIAALTVEKISICGDAKRDEKALGSHTFVDALCILMKHLGSMGCWDQASKCESSLKRLTQFLNQPMVDEKKDDLPFRREVVGQAYLELADFLLQCADYPAHSYYLVNAVLQRREVTPQMATRAALAMLCSSELVDDAIGVNTLTPTIAMARLKQRCSLPPQAEALIACIMDAAAPADFGKLLTGLAELVAGDEHLTPYQDALRHILLRRQLIHHSEASHRVEISQLSTGATPMSKHDFLRVVQPAFLQDKTAPVEFDSKSATMLCRNSTKLKILQSFTKLSAQVGIKVSSAAAHSSKDEAITSEQLLHAHDRTHAIYDLQRTSQETLDQRKRDKKASEEMEQAKRRDDRIQMEKERIVKTKMDRLKKLEPLYLERLRQERCKLVLEKLRAKYPGFKVDNAIAAKKATVFEDEVTLLLAAFKRKAAETDRSDVLKGHLVERALRQKEIPKRKEYEAANAERYRAERAAARDNYLVQHRKEFEKRQHEREVLRQFLPFAQSFEDEWRQNMSDNKPTKQENQNNLLLQEKMRLAAQQ